VFSAKLSYFKDILHHQKVCDELVRDPVGLAGKPKFLVPRDFQPQNTVELWKFQWAASGSLFDNVEGTIVFKKLIYLEFCSPFSRSCFSLGASLDDASSLYSSTLPMTPYNQGGKWSMAFRLPSDEH
jgi:hypothetical protein